MPRSRILLTVAALLLIGFIAVQIWTSRAMITALKAVSEDVDRRLGNLDSGKLSQAKTEEEIRSLRIENERKILFATTFFANLNAAMAILVAFSGGAIAFHQYLGLRRKERLDRAGQDLGVIWKGIGDYNAAVRAASIAALQPFFEAEKSEYHAQVAAALALVGRSDNRDDIVRTTFTRVIEGALRRIPNEILRSVSWQGLRLSNANLSNLDLNGLDLRDSQLDTCDFDSANLSGTRFDAAKLRWCVFTRANLRSAQLRYADLANANLQFADLENADLRNVKILGTNLECSMLTGATFDNFAINWALTEGWRMAKLDADLRDRLVQQYGPEFTGKRILMIVWEHPPFVSGGGWTAIYHLLKSLRLSGTDVTLLVPWSSTEITHAALGFEYPVLSCGIETSPGVPYVSQYSQYSDSSSFVPSNSANLEAARLRSGSLAELIAEFEKRATRLVEDKKLRFDIIHASDWLTFGVAECISKQLSVPWIAHFHSTEPERRSVRPNGRIMETERKAADSASVLVCVGSKTKATLVSRYKVNPSSISVIPNSFWTESTGLHLSGDYEAKRVVFLGRMASQKGPDHFVHIAGELRKLLPSARFFMYGSGNEAPQIAALINKVVPPKEQTWVLTTHSEVTRIVPVGVDPETGEWGNYTPLGSSQQRYILQQLIAAKCQCRIEAIQMTRYFSHLATITKSTDDALIGQRFLISSENHVEYAALPDPFVVMAGEVSWEDRKEIFNGASAVVVSSRSEPFGMVVLEAMEAGVPVFYPSDSGVAEVIQNGVRIEPSDYKGVAFQLKGLLSDPDAWQQTVEQQVVEVRAYQNQGYHMRMQQLWYSQGNHPSQAQGPATKN